LLQNKIHEFRLVGLLILVIKYQAADKKGKANIFKFYLQNTKYINNWDLVDLTVDKIIGDYLVLTGDSLALLNKLASSANLWERRMAIVATYAFIKTGRSDEAFKVASKLLSDKHDLIHKAIGWMLREVGKRVGRQELKRFLDKNIKNMSRTTLRYAIEHFPEAERQFYLQK
jgi:3-methyladenine DNA glycosylase AlkD